MIWLLLTPNIERLILREMTIQHQVKLAMELCELLMTHQFLRVTCDRLGQVSLFYDSDTNVPELQQKLVLLLSSIFPRAVDSIKKSTFTVLSNSGIVQSKQALYSSVLRRPNLVASGRKYNGFELEVILSYVNSIQREVKLFTLRIKINKACQHNHFTTEIWNSFIPLNCVKIM